MRTAKHYQQTDGGAFAAGLPWTDCDCVYRALAIATETPYSVLAGWLDRFIRVYESGPITTDRGKKIPALGIRSSRFWGVMPYTWTKFLQTVFDGWEYVRLPHRLLRHFMIPKKGRIIVSCDRHVAAVVDGVMMDTRDNWGRRKVYGYWIQKSS